MALALREWLPMVLQAVKPWMSAEDIRTGAKWRRELETELEDANVGISCVTPENQLSPWINFEAGALGKAIKDDAAVCALLAPGMSPGDLKEPLASFQAVRADQEGVRKMVLDLNIRLPNPVPEPALKRLFDAVWPELATKLGELPKPESAKQPARPDTEKIDEILQLLRAQSWSPSTEDTALQAMSVAELMDLVRDVEPGVQVISPRWIRRSRAKFAAGSSLNINAQKNEPPDGSEKP